MRLRSIRAILVCVLVFRFEKIKQFFKLHRDLVAFSIFLDQRLKETKYRQHIAGVSSVTSW